MYMMNVSLYVCMIDRGIEGGRGWRKGGKRRGEWWHGFERMQASNTNCTNEKESLYCHLQQFPGSSQSSSFFQPPLFSGENTFVSASVIICALGLKWQKQKARRSYTHPEGHTRTPLSPRTTSLISFLSSFPDLAQTRCFQRGTPGQAVRPGLAVPLDALSFLAIRRLETAVGRGLFFSILNWCGRLFRDLSGLGAGLGLPIFNAPLREREKTR